MNDTKNGNAEALLKLAASLDALAESMANEPPAPEKLAGARQVDYGTVSTQSARGGYDALTAFILG